MPEDLNEEQLNRLWGHATHEENNFNNRLNFFLVFESVFLSSIIGVLFTKSSPGKPVLIIIICLGLILTSLWGYVQARQGYIFEGVKTRLKEVDPQFQVILMKREKVKWPFSNTWLLTYGIPLLVTLVWIMLLVFAFIS